MFTVVGNDICHTHMTTSTTEPVFVCNTLQSVFHQLSPYTTQISIYICSIMHTVCKYIHTYKLHLQLQKKSQGQTHWKACTATHIVQLLTARH